MTGPRELRSVVVADPRNTPAARTYVLVAEIMTGDGLKWKAAAFGPDMRAMAQAAREMNVGQPEAILTSKPGALPLRSKAERETDKTVWTVGTEAFDKLHKTRVYHDAKGAPFTQRPPLHPDLPPPPAQDPPIGLTERMDRAVRAGANVDILREQAAAEIREANRIAEAARGHAGLEAFPNMDAAIGRPGLQHGRWPSSGPAPTVARTLGGRR